MDLLKNQLRKRLAEKFLGKQAIGVLVGREIQQMYPQNDMSIYVKHSTVFVETSDRALQIFLYRDKPKILVSVNQKLEGLGYSQRMKEIIFKQKKHSGGEHLEF